LWNRLDARLADEEVEDESNQHLGNASNSATKETITRFGNNTLHF